MFADCFDPRLTAPVWGEKPSLRPLPQGARGQPGVMAGDQLEVSECTLPGPSVGEVTDEGVVASCQPPLAWKERGREVSPL